MQWNMKVSTVKCIVIVFWHRLFLPQFGSNTFSMLVQNSPLYLRSYFCVSFFCRGKRIFTSPALNHCSRQRAFFGRTLTRLSFCRLFKIKPEMKLLNKNDSNRCSVEETRLGNFSCEIMTGGLK